VEVVGGKIMLKRYRTTRRGALIAAASAALLLGVSPSAVQAQELSGELVILQWLGGIETDVWNDLTSAFEEANPGVTVRELVVTGVGFLIHVYSSLGSANPPRLIKNSRCRDSQRQQRGLRSRKAPPVGSRQAEVQHRETSLLCPHVWHVEFGGHDGLEDGRRQRHGSHLRAGKDARAVLVS
jgi:hypothetical protein